MRKLWLKAQMIQTKCQRFKAVVIATVVAAAGVMILLCSGVKVVS
jgi:hypothetical protein